MERDFLGLSSKNISVAVKEEPDDDPNSSAQLRGSGMQWSFSNKISAVPQFLSFRAAQEDRSRKTVLDPLASSGYMAISTADVYNSNPKPYSSIIQKNLTIDKQVGNHYAMTVYPLQHRDIHSVHRPHEAKIFPVSNQQHQTTTVALGTTALQSHHIPPGLNVVGSTVKPPLKGVIAPMSVLPCTSSVVGTTDLRNVSKSSVTPAQLTIFYAGSVGVYDDVTPEKAQAIMLLAGKGFSPTHNKTFSTAQEPSPSGSFSKNQQHTTTLFPGLPKPLSLASQGCSQSGAGASSASELGALKPTEASSFPTTHSEPPKVVSLAERAGGLPQARKASLARFLEKRKERVMHSSPYNVTMKSPECGPLRSDGAGLSPLTAIN
ncbi:Protein TIFY 6B [Morella rubra]|uniref:Protein TIFY n=1 Tax=Morella rubra TaxID=262757 RepID=A0A6A1VJX5_9ROSI|nr:Protein TIFY 6B [Morella rubra]